MRAAYERLLTRIVVRALDLIAHSASKRGDLHEIKHVQAQLVAGDNSHALTGGECCTASVLSHYVPREDFIQ